MRLRDGGVGGREVLGILVATELRCVFAAATLRGPTHGLKWIERNTGRKRNGGTRARPADGGGVVPWV